MFDELLSTEPMLNTTKGKIWARIIGRKWDQDGKLIGHYHNSPILYTRVYLVQFPDGSISNYAANIIAEAIHG